MKSYFRYVRKENGAGIGAIAIEEDEHGIFNVGASVCAPNDTFSKDTARFIAFNKVSSIPLRFSFYELVDNDWYDEFVSILPYRDEAIELFVATFFDMIDDIIMDYAKEHYKTLI